MTDATTATVTLVANSDGSFTTTESVVPERVRRADGTWVAVDTTLQANGDGTFSPVASPTAVVLSGGGSGPLAKTASDGQELVWTWAGITLPAPTLAGDVATYAGVLPDVDLKVHVDEWGFSEVLVVKTAAAAANPALAALRFALSGTGLTAAGTATSPAQAVSDAFEISDAYMWDSTLPATLPPASMPAAEVQSETVSTIDGPGSGAKVVSVPETMAGSTLVVTPVQSLLTDATAAFPIFIDPKSSSPARSYWAMINSGHKDQQYWNYDRADHAKVGNAGDGTNMYRSLFQFFASAWQNKHVTDVTFSDDLVYSWNCASTTTELHLSSQTLSVNTTWNTNATSWGSSLATVSNANCTSASGKTSEWSSTALTSAVNTDRASSTITVGLRAASETVSYDGSNGWKKFDETSGSGGAHLSVTYNTAPVLSLLHTDAGACASSASGAPALWTGGTPAHNPFPQLTVTDLESDKSTVTFSYPNGSGGVKTTAYPNVASKATQKLVGGIPAANIPDTSTTGAGTTYSWSVIVSDGTDSATARCYFKVDNTVAAPPTIVNTDDHYPDDDAPHDGVGKPGQFLITATGTAAQVGDVVAYEWGPTSGGSLQTVPTTKGAPVSVSYTPAYEGDTELQAFAVTTAGAVSTVAGSADFTVASPDVAVGDWALNGDGTDSGSGGNTATATNVTWPLDARQIGQSAAHFNGASSVLSAAVPIHTNTSFAVSAWVRPSGTSCTTNAVGQDGVHTSGFYLGCYQGKFDFDVISSDSATVATTRVVSTAAAPMGLWSNIVGVYDLSAGTINLYVNGVVQGSGASLAAPLWDAAGPFVIGRQRYNDASSGWWAGDISEVRVWDRVAYQSDIDDAVSLASWADQYPLDMTKDPTTDAHGQHPLTWFGSPQVATDDMNPPGTGGTFGTALSSANPDYAKAAGPSVRTDGSFSVSAWVDPAALAGTYVNAVGQNGTVTSNFGLGLSSSNKYVFWMHGSDATSPTATLIQSTDAAVVGQWVNLIGTFDFATRQLTLYVNGVSQGSVAFSATPWQAAGAVTVGSGLWQNAIGYLWNGGLDNVGLFNGPLNATQISNLYMYNNPFYVPEQ